MALGLLTFNEFIRHAAKCGVGINGCRPDFHAFCYPDGEGGDEHGLVHWWFKWRAFCSMQDARDEAEIGRASCRERV